MEKVVETTPPKPTELIEKTPPQTLKVNQKSPNSIEDAPKYSTPDPLKVPKAFKYPERYRSPTDLMISPVSKGLLARSKKPVVLLPPPKNQPKDVGVFQI